MATAQDVANFLGQSDRDGTVLLAGERLPLVTTFIRAYVRGNGFTADGATPNADLDAVIVSVTARMVSNPDRATSSVAGPFTVTYGPTVDGFTLLELAVLHMYRKRAV